MEEIARTFDELGLTPGILEGAADLTRSLRDAAAHESPESRTALATLTQWWPCWPGMRRRGPALRGRRSHRET
jgi:hypothetical protein